MPWENPGSVEITTHTTAAGYLRHESRGQTLDATGLAELPGVTRATVDRDLQFAQTWLYRRPQPRLPAASKGN